MKQYLNLLQEILQSGQREPNRTGVDTLTLPGAMLKFDLRDGFPAVTTKKLFFNGVKGELIGFLEGASSAARFRELGCNVWNVNANEHNVDAAGNHVENKWLSNPNRKGEDDMGRVYGAQWRDWTGLDTSDPYVHERISIDQIANALHEVRHNPESRRIIVEAWNPAEIDQMCLPACHTDFQLLPRSDGTLHMTFKLRSCDTFLGAPFNIASYALLLELFARWTGRTAATLTMFISDAHIYTNHIEQVKLQLSREPLPLPKIVIDKSVGGSHTINEDLDTILARLTPAHIALIDYQYHPAIAAPMAG